MPRAHAIQTSEITFDAVLAAIQGQVEYLYVETASTSHWSTFDVKAIPPLCTRFRAFGSRCDVQCWRQGDQTRVTVVHDGPRLPLPAAATLDLAELDSEEVTFVLWGERASTDTTWREAGFQRCWEYPVAGAPSRVGVRAIEYRDRDTGDLQFVRYVSLTPMGDKA